MSTRYTFWVQPAVAASTWWILLGGIAYAGPDDNRVPSESAALREEFEQDNRARELAWQQANVARDEARRGDRTAALDRFKKALELAAQIQGNRKRTTTLVHIATVQAEVGDTQGALQTARSIQDMIERDSTLRTMALDRAKAGDVEAATLFAKAIQDNSKRTNVTIYIDAVRSAKTAGY